MSGAWQLVLLAIPLTNNAQSIFLQISFFGKYRYKFPHLKSTGTTYLSLIIAKVLNFL